MIFMGWVSKVMSGRSWTWLFAAPALLVGLAATIALTLWHASQNERLAAAAFYRETRSFLDVLQLRIDGYGHGLRGGRGIVLANPELGVGEYETYALSRDLPNEFPGVTGMAFIRHAPAEAADGATVMRVEHAYPPVLKSQISGFDIAHLPILRSAALLAVQRSDITLAYNAVSSITGNDGQDLLLLLPIFKPVEQKTTLSTLLGWSAFVIDIDRMFAGLGGTLFDFEVRDITHQQVTQLIHTSPRQDMATEPHAYAAIEKLRIDFGGRVWEIRVLPRADLSFATGQIPPILTAMAGSIVSFLTAWILVLLGQSVRQAAEHKNHAVQLDAIFTLSPDGFVAFDAEHYVRYVNPAFLRMTGYLANEIIGLDEYLFSVYLARDCSLKTPFIGIEAMRRMTEVDAQTHGHHVESASLPRIRLEFDNAGKTVVECQLRLALAPNVSQILYVRDITHEAEVNQMKSEFLAHAAHELRTPMTSIYGYSEMLIHRDFDAETRREVLGTIHKQTAWLVDIVNELLDLARIEARQGKDYRIEPVALLPLVEEVVASMGLEPAHWPVTIRIPDSLPAALADIGKLRQALVNIIGNARKYSPVGASIEIDGLERLVSDEWFVGVAVTDHGIGLTPEQAARVGERFFRADHSGKVPGTGLGMAIVRETIEQLGGSLSVTCTPGEGTTVTLWLPIAAMAAIGPSIAGTAS
jgi:signal transduction histidine kinase